MQISGNTILITGGGSGIGRALAEALQARGNTVIIAGRRAAVLDEVTEANPGMKSLTLDIADAAGIDDFAGRIGAAFPALNVVINNAGIMRPERIGEDGLETAEATIATNLLGPIRLTNALLPLLQKQPAATVMLVSSGLAFVPMVATPTYCATKAAIHSYALTLRRQLAESAVEVLELIPPYVQTELMGAAQASDERAMPLAAFIAEVMKILEQQPASGEIVVERCRPLRFATKDGKFKQMFEMLNQTD